MMKVVIYSRFSSDMQDEKSIEDQQRTCEAFAASKGWTVISSYSDRAISGASLLNRPQMQKLLEAARTGLFDIVLSEALDRLSRDLGDTASIYNQLKFADVKLHTLSEGEITEMHVGFKGTMNSMFLDELRRKTHRGLEGRALQGKSAGGKAYGYDVVRSLNARGEIITGDRQINACEADVVRRIFRDYCKGKSPKKIAHELNAEGIPGPTGKGWGPSTINGNRDRGTGILNNELYVGRQVWNRLRYAKDPRTGKRVSKLNPESDWVVAEVPELRIVDQELWQAAKDHQATLQRRQSPWDKRRPVHLLSYLLKCGECGGGMSIVSSGRYGCSTARNKGTCSNRTTIAKDDLEARVLDALRNRLMDPELTKVFCEEYTRHLNQVRHERNAARAQRQRQLAKIEREMEKTYQAMLDGVALDFVKSKFESLEAQKLEVEGFLEANEEAPVFVHPNMAQRYATAIRDLMESLNDAEHRQEAAKTIRSLVDEIVLTPNSDRSELIADMKGDLAAILSMANAKDAKPRSRDQMSETERKEIERVENLIYPSEEDSAPCMQPCKDKMVAGVGFEPTTFRL